MNTRDFDAKYPRQAEAIIHRRRRRWLWYFGHACLGHNDRFGIESSAKQNTITSTVALFLAHCAILQRIPRSITDRQRWRRTLLLSRGLPSPKERWIGHQQCDGSWLTPGLADGLLILIVHWTYLEKRAEKRKKKTHWDNYVSLGFAAVIRSRSRKNVSTPHHETMLGWDGGVDESAKSIKWQEVAPVGWLLLGNGKHHHRIQGTWRVPRDRVDKWPPMRCSVGNDVKWPMG